MNDSSASRNASALDRAIDRAVRSMMQVDPPAGLGRRVMARLQRPERRGGWLTGWLIPVAAVAMFLVAVVLMRDQPGSPVSAPVVAPPSVAANAPAPDASAPTPAPVAPASTRPRASVSPRVPSRERIPMPAVANVFGPRSGRVASAALPSEDAVWPSPSGSDTQAPLHTVAPIVVPPVAMPPIETPAIVIPPLPSATPRGGA